MHIHAYIIRWYKIVEKYSLKYLDIPEYFSNFAPELKYQVYEESRFTSGQAH